MTPAILCSAKEIIFTLEFEAERGCAAKRERERERERNYRVLLWDYEEHTARDVPVA
jgi:hypothetical protein